MLSNEKRDVTKCYRPKQTLLDPSLEIGRKKIKQLVTSSSSLFN